MRPRKRAQPGGIRRPSFLSAFSLWQNFLPLNHKFLMCGLHPCGCLRKTVLQNTGITPAPLPAFVSKLNGEEKQVPHTARRERVRDDSWRCSLQRSWNDNWRGWRDGGALKRSPYKGVTGHTLEMQGAQTRKY
jgi:hypothetical protein